jgi:hypothetical protein
MTTKAKTKAKAKTRKPKKQKIKDLKWQETLGKPTSFVSEGVKCWYWLSVRDDQKVVRLGDEERVYETFVEAVNAANEDNRKHVMEWLVEKA